MCDVVALTHYCKLISLFIFCQMEEQVVYCIPPASVFTARCTIVQSAVLRLHVVRLSVRPSVTLVDEDHVGWKSWKLIGK